MLAGGEAVGEERLHLLAERVELEVERAREQPLARPDARGRERQEALQRRLELPREVGGRHAAVHEAVTLRFARRNRHAEATELRGALDPDAARQANE